MGKGVIIDFDFAAMKGAELLFKTTREFLSKLDKIKLDAALEARYLAGRDLLAGLTDLFSAVKTKKTAAKAAKELAAAHEKALTAALESALTPGLRNFVKALTGKGVRVVFLTRVPAAVAQPLFETLGAGLYPEPLALYNGIRADAWRRACHQHHLPYASTLTVPGTGFGVRAAIRSGMGAIAVVDEHVAYQDFGGADEVIRELSGTTAKTILKRLRID